MLGDVIVEEGAEKAQLVVILVVKLLAFLGLQEVIGAILITILDREHFQLTLTGRLNLENNTIFNVKLCSFKGVKGLSEVLDVNNP